MLKQMSSRNQRSKGFKVKRTLQICVLIAICIWLLYQLKHYHDNKAYEEASAKISEKVDGRHEIKFGRRGLHPPMTKTVLGIEKRGGGEKALEERNGGRGDEIDGHDQGREEEEESEEVEGLIDEEDKEREEESEEMETAIEDVSSVQE